MLPDATPAGRSQNAERSKRMIECLRQNLLYSDKRVRDMLFQAAEQTIATRREGGTVLRVSKLTREMAVLGRQWAQSAGVTANWEMASRAVVNTMIKAGVLLNEEGLAVTDGIGAQAAAIGSLVEGFQQVCEAFLLEFLVRKLGDVSARDHKALAHALFRQFDSKIPMDDLEDRVAILFAGMAEAIALAEDGTYLVLGPSHLTPMLPAQC